MEPKTTSPAPAGRELPATWSIRRPAIADLPAVNGLILAFDLDAYGEPDQTEDDLRAFWADLDLAEDAWLVEDEDGRLVGYLAVTAEDESTDIWADGYVHPAFTRRGIGTTFMRLSAARAAELAAGAPAGRTVTLTHAHPAAASDAARLFAEFGLAPVRYFWRMAAEVGPGTALEVPAWPDGVTVAASAGPGEAGPTGPEPWERPNGSLAGERAAAVLAAQGRVYDVVNEAFADHWDHVDRPFTDWYAERAKELPDPSLWFIALDGDEPAGSVMGTWSNGQGWVKCLAVRRPWRGKGLGMALLRHVFAEFARRGAVSVALGVDAANPTGATRLYERAGMRQTREFALYRRELTGDERKAVSNKR